MGYRLPPAPDHEVHIDGTATETVIHVDNGSTTYVTIPCFYRNGHVITWLDVARVDHCGWPAPDHPDRSFQRCHHHDLFDEIDLAEEGYDTASVSFDEAPTGLSAYAEIYDVNKVRIKFEALCDDAVKEDVRVPFSVAISDGDVSPTLRSVVTKGVLHIVHAPFDV